ncbi:MAG: selenide, water dikinase SelD [Actinomycetota bacterium]|nr:selenide, water dikinase SelD [Actinomycetota bacterium]
MTAFDVPVRLTSFTSGGGCSCKVPAGELESLLDHAYGGQEAAAPISVPGVALVWGLEGGDDAALVDLGDGRCLVSTTDFFPPVVDDPYDWGRIAAANALSDVYAMGGEPICSLNLLAWPTDRLAPELAEAVLRGGRAVCDLARCPVAGGHSIRDDTPKYGLAVTGIASRDRLLRNDAAEAGLPIGITKPLGVGILNNRHKATGERFAEAIETMAALNAEASRAALAAGVRAATDVTGFGLLGHLYKMLRASKVSARLDSAAVPYLDGARASLAAGFVPGGSRANLEWVRQHLDTDCSESELLLLADAQTSGGLLVVGEVPGVPIIGEITAGPEPRITID